MQLLKLIDIEVDLPETATLTKRRPEPGVLFFGVSCASAADVRAQVETAARARGYELRRAPDASHLLRRDQRINILAPDPARLDITVDDPEALPMARLHERGIALGPLAIELEAARITPRRERHDEDSTCWKAEWLIYGRSIQELCSQLHERLTRQGLRSNGIWPPPKGGIQQWHIEAHSPRRLVKVYISPAEDHLMLSITLIDNAEEA